MKQYRTTLLYLQLVSKSQCCNPQRITLTFGIWMCRENITGPRPAEVPFWPASARL
jgi:hypothetical protein